MSVLNILSGRFMMIHGIHWFWAPTSIWPLNFLHVLIYKKPPLFSYVLSATAPHGDQIHDVWLGGGSNKSHLIQVTEMSESPGANKWFSTRSIQIDRRFFGGIWLLNLAYIVWNRFVCQLNTQHWPIRLHCVFIQIQKSSRQTQKQTWVFWNKTLPCQSCHKSCHPPGWSEQRMHKIVFFPAQALAPHWDFLRKKFSNGQVFRLRRKQWSTCQVFLFFPKTLLKYQEDTKVWHPLYCTYCHCY